MIMDPTDFHKTADFLKDYQEEWHVRTSISRSYYGLFLHLRDFLTSQGVTLPNRSRHKFIFTCFHESRFFKGAESKNNKVSRKEKGKIKDKVIWDIAKRLKSLLQARNDADYKLHFRVTSGDSKHNLKLATSAIEDFEKLRGSDREKHIVKVALQQKKDFPLHFNRHTTP